MTEKKKTGTARFTTEPETLGGTSSFGIDEDFGVPTGKSYIYRTKNGKTRSIGREGLPLPDAKAKEYASELQRETRGMKKMATGGMAYAKGGGIESQGKTKGKIITMKSGGKMC